MSQMSISAARASIVRKKGYDGWLHGRVTLFLTFPAALAGALAGVILGLHPLVGAGMAAAGNLLGLILEPDLDHPSLTSSEWRVLKLPLLGMVLGPIWVAIWLPYSRLFKHRSPFTHWPVLGTAIRVLYLGVWVFLAAQLLDLTGLTAGLSRGVVFAGALMFLGLSISDTGHWVVDRR